MCGIVGYVGNEAAWPIVLAGLQRLEYRGYDSAGIAALDRQGRLQFRKAAGKVANLALQDPSQAPPGSLGLGHTRWATHGRPSDTNSHPHSDCRRQIAIAHNGIVENYLELKRRLIDQGHRFLSDTDSEVIPHLIEEKMREGLGFAEAFRVAGRELRGSQAVAGLHEKEGVLCALRLGHAGGVVVAQGEGQGMVGSDLPAVLPLLRGSSPGLVGYLEAGEMAVVTRQGARYFNLDGQPIQKRLRPASPEDVLVDKGGYPHFMLKEIMEQAEAVTGALRERVDFETGLVELPGFPLSVEEMRGLRRVVLIGCGTSLHAAQVGRHLVERFAGLPAEAESASEYRYRNPYLDRHTLVVSVGQSGETADTVAAMQEVKDRGARLLTICNSEDSQAARLAEGTLHMRAGIEIGVASTKTFLASLTILNLLAMYLGQARETVSRAQGRELVDSLARCPGLIGELLADTKGYERLAERLAGFPNMLFLGRGVNAPIASEGALKLKEVSYLHAEGYPAGEMKHGPIALVDGKLATVALAPADFLRDKMLNNIKEVKAREGFVLAVLTQGDEELAGQVDEAVFIPPAPEHITPLLATIPLQLLAYHVAVRRGCDVDQPRNLAKSVTVE